MTPRPAQSALLVRVVLGGVCLVLAALAGGACGGPQRDAAGSAAAILGDARRFDNPRESIESLAEVSAILLTEGRRCAPAEARRRTHCEAILAGTGLVQAFTVAAGACALPDIERGRRRLRDYMQAVDALPEDARHAPELPALPAC